MSKRKLRILAAGLSLLFTGAWFAIVVPTVSAAVSAAPMITASKTGFFAWADWMRAFFLTQVLSREALFSNDWLSVGSLAAIGVFLLIAAAVAFSALRPRPLRNDIIDAQPPAAGSNEYGNRRWMRSEAELSGELGLATARIEELADAPSGLYCGSFGKDAVIASDDEHMLILAPTRVGKTRRVLLPMIATLLKTGESFCAFDPKGELFGYTSTLAKSTHEVNRLDLREPQLGNRINVLAGAIRAYMGREGEKPVESLFKALDAKRKKLAGQKDAKEIRRLNADIMGIGDEITRRLEEAEHEVDLVTSFVFPREIEKEGNSKFFNDGAENLIKMTLHYLCGSMHCPKSDKGLYLASKLISELCQPEKLTKAPGEDRIFSPLIEEVHQLNHRHPAYVYMAKIDGSRNLSDFITTATGALSRYTSSSMARMMTETDLPFEELGDRPTATYIIVPNDDDTYNQVAMLFVAQLYSALMRRADACGGRLPVRMNMICEELKQLPVINGLDQKLSICAGYGVRWVLVLQSLTQLQSAYGKEDAATIMENCRIQMCLLAGTPETGKYIEERCGTYTINLASTSSSKVPHGLLADRATSSHSLGKRARCSADEAQNWNPDQGAILLKVGCQPACTPLPELSRTPFNAMLGMSTPERNTALQKEVRSQPAHTDRVELPDWSIELNTHEKASCAYTDEERKKLRRNHLRKLLGLSKARQGLGSPPEEKGDGGGKPRKAPEKPAKEPVPSRASEII